ncbi:amidohydrolase family protein [Natrarchaeobius chitinivorans]|uniref:Amidohydrolase n=1 Tax=Natrarchaeobius chitinivorans TaxID=1679083 RepID=A0A3N6M3U3_NATCH|nr:amidohydrolase family protein [Natrarchaeobius chitinivorans]RQG96617.1 amidohydrolase [Natrarchaeobius chitinivorans]
MTRTPEDTRDDDDQRVSGRESATRRRVLARSVSASIGVVGAAGSTTAGETDRAPGADAATADREDDSVTDPPLEPMTDLPLFDAHTHVIPEETLDRPPLSGDELVEWMDDVGVDRAVVLALDSPESYPVQAPSWWVLEEVEAHPDRLVPFCTVDPRTLVYGDEPVENLIERYVERGARGFGELKAGLPIDDSRLETLYERCAEYDLPILFHTDEKAMMDEVGLPRLEDVLASYPSVDFLAHAHAWWAHISADVSWEDRGQYPDGPIEPGGRVSELLGAYDNIYGDISGFSGWNALTRDEEYAQEFLEEHSEQLVFGTDYLYPGQEISHFELFDRFDLDRDAWADLRYRNLEGVLR